MSRPFFRTIGVVSVLLVSGCSLFASHSSTGSKLDHGVVADPTLGIRISAPNKYNGDTVKIVKAVNPPVARDLSFATQVGDVLSVEPATTIVGASVHLSFDPARDLHPVHPGETSPTISNAFIATYNDVAEAWLPLDTTYDAATHELVAVAPHFSLFSRYVVNPITTVVANPFRQVVGSVVDGVASTTAKTVQVVGNTITSGVEAFAQYLDASMHDYLKHLTDDATGVMEPDHRADCGNTSSTWSAFVATKTKFLGTCAVTDPSGSTHEWLRVENRRSYPVDLIPPHGALDASWNAYDTSMLDDLPVMLLRRGESAVGDGLAGSLRSTEMTIPSTAHSMSINVSADFLAIAMDMILAALSIVPGEAEFEGTLVTVIREEISDGDLAEGSQVIERLTVIVEENPKLKLLPDSAEKAAAITDGLDCLNSSESAFHHPSFTTVLDTVRRCAGQAAEQIGGDLGKLIAGAFSQTDVANEFADFVRHGNHIDTIGLVRSDRWPKLDWDSIGRKAVGCEPPTGESWDTMDITPEFKDLTGDGLNEAIIVAECPSPTAEAGAEVFVYDGRDRSTPLTPILTIGDANFEEINLSYTANSITLSGDAVSATAPLCCPDIRITETYKWSGSHFIRTKRTQKSI